MRTGVPRCDGCGIRTSDDAEVALTANIRSILMEESKLAPGGELADWSDVAATESNAAAPSAISPQPQAF